MCARLRCALAYTYALLVLINGAPPVERLNEPEANVNRDHLDGIALERDGELNKKFRHEVLLGRAAGNSSDANSAIRQMFKRADADNDGFLSEQELEEEIHRNTENHIADSHRDAAAVFKKVDVNVDDQISWPEYRAHLVVETRIPLKDTGEPLRDEDQHLLDEERVSFNENDVNGDGFLEKGEWEGFLHPELSSEAIESLADSLMKAYDKDGNNMISRDEFVDFLPGEIEGPYAKQEQSDSEARGTEFDRDLDANKDGFATLEELIGFVNPRGEGRHHREVSELMAQCDRDQNGKLSLDEMLSQNILLERSSLLAVDKRLHDDL